MVASYIRRAPFWQREAGRVLFSRSLVFFFSDPERPSVHLSEGWPAKCTGSFFFPRSPRARCRVLLLLASGNRFRVRAHWSWRAGEHSQIRSLGCYSACGLRRTPLSDTREPHARGKNRI